MLEIQQNFIGTYFYWNLFFMTSTFDHDRTGQDRTGPVWRLTDGTGQDDWRRDGTGLTLTTWRMTWLDDWRDDETRQTAKEKIKNIFCNEFVFFLKITINITSEKRLTTDWLCRLPTDDFWLDYALPWLTTTSLADWTKNNEIKIRRNDCEIYCDADFWEVCFLNDKKNIFQN